MPDDQKDLAYYLSKAADFRNKAKVVSEPGLKAALEAVARECMAKARELIPLYPQMAGNPKRRHSLAPQAIRDGTGQLQTPARCGMAAIPSIAKA